MKTSLRKLSLLAGALIFMSYAFESPAQQKYSREIDPYVDFLKTQDTDAKDYIFNLWKTFDVVVICERMHPEYTQYDFFFDIVTDTRFIEMRGMVYTEIFSLAGTEMYYDLTFGDGTEDPEAVIERIQLDTGFWPSWDCRGMHDFLTKLYNFNMGLPAEKRVRWMAPLKALDWNLIQTGEDLEYWKEIGKYYDFFIADNINKAFSRSGGTKSLVILNYRHAFMNSTWEKGNSEVIINNNAASIMKYRFGMNVANVWLNDANTSRLNNPPVMKGKWDAAFKALGNPRLGFDMKESPLGAAHFEIYPQKWKKHNLDFEDVFHGFVFYNPVEDFVTAQYFPEYFSDPANVAELKRRAGLIGKPAMARKLTSPESIKTARYSGIKATKRKINRWLD